MNNQKLKKLDMNLLLIFDGALRHRKFSVVADQLALSQPAISHAIGRLREVFEDELFIRRPHGVEPTRRAIELGPRIARLLQAARDAIDEPDAFDPATTERVFRVSGLDYEVSWLGPTLTSALCHHAPHARLAFKSMTRQQALKSLEDGETDLAFGYFLTSPTDIVIRPVFSETYLVAAAANNRFIKDELTLDLYCDTLRHLLVSIDGSFSGTIDAALEGIGRRRKVVATLPLFLPALATVARTDVIVTMPARIVRIYGESFGLRVYEPPLPIRPFDLMVAWHRRDDADAGIKWLLQQIGVPS